MRSGVCSKCIQVLRLVALFVLLTSGSYGQLPKSPLQKYDSIQNVLSSGWNTWNTHSVLSHVFLPDGFAINLGLKDNRITEDRYLNESYISQKSKRPEIITPGLHAHDGSYTALRLQWKDIVILVESASHNNQLSLLITPITVPERSPSLIAEGAMLWNRPGVIKKIGKSLNVETDNATFIIQGTDSMMNEHLPLSGAYLSFRLDRALAICSGEGMTLEEVKKTILEKRKALEDQYQAYGELSRTYTAIQNVIAWNTIYDPTRGKVITPVSRFWNTFFGGNSVLFCWDTYFAAYLASVNNKNLAYANAMEVTRSVKKYGMVPNYVGDSGLGSPDRSQPPIGSLIIREIYRKYEDKWFLELVFDDLLTWNRWWPKHRSNGQFLSWGSDYIPPPYDDDASHNRQGAAYESGLDNSPMYDEVPFNPTLNVIELADVGLLSLYITDCKALAEIAASLGKSMERKELLERARHYTKSIRRLWNGDKGMFYNQRTDTNESSVRISPTNFYPLLAGVVTQKEAELMMKKHYFNPQEFYGEWMIPSVPRSDSAFSQQDYWRGRIWAPLNILVYMGMRNYNLENARKDLVQKSNRLLINSFSESGNVYENYHALSGKGLNPGEALNKSDSFYHWGGLLGLPSLIEGRYLEGHENPLKTRGK